MSLFWNSEELIQMHIELTNACNAACPMCVRTFNNSPLTRPDLEIGQITLDQFKKYFPPHIIQRCNLILFCGVHGDPGTARDTYEIFKYIRECSDRTAVRMNTNGGMRRPDWWYKMGQLFAGQKKPHPFYWALTFSIDGLSDTNHLYRRNVDWNILIENVKAFIDGGGTAIWDYLIFKHNEHQILEAKELASKLGFDEFIPKKSLGVDDGVNLKPMPVLDKEGNLEYIIEAPVNSKNRNLENPNGTTPIQMWTFTPAYYRQLKETKENVKDFQSAVKTVYEDRLNHKDYTKYDTCKIDCKAQRQNGKEIFIDNFGRVMPCCYIGTHLNGIYRDDKTLQLHKHMNDYGWEHFHLEHHSLEEILDSGHLDNVFANTWNKESVRGGKLLYCADTCGTFSSIDRIFTHEINFKAEKPKCSIPINK
jgi:MoaA/NifB/PqqE/SkfB family radical SAM enzyme